MGEPVEVEGLEPPPQPEREAAATAIAEAIASERMRLRRRRRPGNRPRKSAPRAMAGSAVRAAESRDVGGLPIDARPLPPAPPGAVEAMVMVPVTEPPAGRMTVAGEKEQVGRWDGRAAAGIGDGAALGVMVPAKLLSEV